MRQGNINRFKSYEKDGTDVGRRPNFERNETMIDVWEGHRLEEGEYVSDGRIFFRRADVKSKRLLNKLHDSGSSIIKTQKSADKLFKDFKAKSKQILEFDTYMRYRYDDIDSGMVFKDCFGDEWKIQRKYYQLAKKILGFDYLLGIGSKKDGYMVVFVKDSETIGFLMCFI